MICFNSVKEKYYLREKGGCYTFISLPTYYCLRQHITHMRSRVIDYYSVQSRDTGAHWTLSCGNWSLTPAWLRWRKRKRKADLCDCWIMLLVRAVFTPSYLHPTALFCSSESQWHEVEQRKGQQDTMNVLWERSQMMIGYGGEKIWDIWLSNLWCLSELRSQTSLFCTTSDSQCHEGEQEETGVEGTARQKPEWKECERDHIWEEAGEGQTRLEYIKEGVVRPWLRDVLR